ncbi:MAG TPA: serine/threonine-protein kinase [Chthonomonadaceae bacterium]|nr:serine/threonine-protein kinase [Chthonomonadaceae bacterium]
MPLGMLGKYERLDVLGHGVSGIVYLAKDTLLNKQVALKEVDVQAGDLRRFLEEARVMDRLRHPNIVRVNSVDRIDGKVVIAMEYVRGQNLQEILRAEGHLPLDRALDIAAQILDALDYAHRMQTVHRDIKPANILLSREGTVKLVDFGLAEILATNAYAGGAGTYAYMAPEDFAEEERSDNQSDIWAVGVTLYEMLTGQRPFQVAKAKDPFSWKRALETQAPTPLTAYLPGAPAELQAVLDRALARDKRQRYQTAGEFREDILGLREAFALHPPQMASVVQPAASPFRAPEEEDDLETRNGVGSAPEVPPLGVLPPRTETGLLVADVNSLAGEERAASEANKTRKSRLPFVGRKQEAARLIVEPVSVDFGAVRKGEQRSVRLQARVMGLEGRVRGRVVHRPGWLSVHPTSFDRTRQAITLTAHSERAWMTGDFQESVRVETEAGTATIPIHLTVIKPRPTFWQIAAWYVPLFVSALLPVLAVAFGNGQRAVSMHAAQLVPPAATASGLLSLMLLLIGIAADIGIAERIACGIVAVVMGLVLGVSMGAPYVELAHPLMQQRVLVTGGIIGAVLALQMLYLSRWKFWALVLVGLGVLIGGTFLRVLYGINLRV